MKVVLGMVNAWVPRTYVFDGLDEKVERVALGTGGHGDFDELVRTLDARVVDRHALEASCRIQYADELADNFDDDFSFEILLFGILGQVKHVQDGSLNSDRSY